MRICQWIAVTAVMTRLLASPHSPIRALWVWEPEAWLNAARGENLIQLAREQGISELFLQVPYEGPVLSHQKELRRFLQACGRHEIRVHALDGYPEAALRRNHPAVMDMARAVMAFNASAEPDSRFYGIHFDHEPYLLPAYDSRFQPQILSEYLELNAAAAKLVAGSGLVCGADIPFWFSSVRVSFRGTGKDVTAHLLDWLDNIGIMDYRNMAGGPDGLIAHAREPLACAGRAGKRVYVGVETAPDEARAQVFLWGFSKAAWDRVDVATYPALFSSRMEGFRVALLAGAARRYAGLVVPAEPSRMAAFQAALRKLQDSTGAVPRSDCERLLGDAPKDVAGSGEYQGFEPFYWPDDPCPAGFRSASRPVPKITFAGKSAEYFERELERAAMAFQSERGFYGFAIHHYTSYRTLLGR